MSFLNEVDLKEETLSFETNKYNIYGSEISLEK